MPTWRWLLAGALAVPLAANGPSAISAQGTDAPAAAASDTAASDTAAAGVPPDAAAAAVAADDNLLDDDALDELVAPIALYPDALLAQVFVAATYPLDVMKAARFVDENKALSDKDRNAKAAEEDWDPSIAALAGGFPTVIQRMADDIDWTQELGDAMLAQTDDVLDAVQRQRSRAVATGYLTSNEAQVVDTSGDSIAIEPTDPDVVYVPTYDSQAAYTTAPTAAPVVAQPGTSSWSTGSVLATGAIAFGSAMLLDDIFDDDDHDDYDYWRGPSHIDWDDDAFYPNRGGRGINANGDVNIDVDRTRNRVKIGNADRSRVDRDGAWQPTPAQRAEARNRVAARDPGAARGTAAQDKLKARSQADNGSRQKLQAAADKRHAAGKPPVAGTHKATQSALKPASRDAAKTKAAAARGSGSIDKSKLATAQKTRAAKAPAAKPKAISRPAKASVPKAHAAPKTSAFKKSSSGSRTHAASSRGHRSAGGGGGRRH